MGPLVSFLMPVAAPAPFLELALEGLINQTVTDWELVLVVDGDAPVVAQTAAQFIPEDKLRVILNPDRMGVAASLNRGLAACRGTYVARIDSDDICRPERIERQASFLHTNPTVGLVGSSAAIIDVENQTLGWRRVDSGPNLRQRLVFRNQFVHSSVMFRLALVDVLGGYNVKAERREDYELWLRMALAGSVANIPRPLVNYRLSHDQYSRHPASSSALRLVGEAQRRLAENLEISGARARAGRLVWRLSQGTLGQRLLSRRRRYVGTRGLQVEPCQSGIGGEPFTAQGDTHSGAPASESADHEC